jgi:integrase
MSEAAEKPDKRKGRRVGNNAGSIFEQKDKRHGTRWCAEYCYRTPDGQRKRARVYAPSHDGAVKRLAALITEIDKHGAPPSSESLEAWLRTWLEQLRTEVRPTTYRGCRQVVELHIIPRLGRVRLRNLTKFAIRRFLSECAATPRQSRRRKVVPAAEGQEPATPLGPAPAPKCLSARYVRLIRATLQWALTDAKAAKRIAENPATGKLLPKPRRTRMALPTAEQMDGFFTSTANHPLSPLFVVGLASGARQGELLGLTWDHVTLPAKPADAGDIRITRQLQRVPKDAAYRDEITDLGGGYALVPLKTEESHRIVPLTLAATDALRAHSRRQAEARLKLGAEWGNRIGLVFTTELGAPLNGTTTTHTFQRLLRKAGLGSHPFHQLRHLCASFLLAMKTPDRLVADHLGHTDTRTTTMIYQDVLPEVQRETARRLEALFPGQKSA